MTATTAVLTNDKLVNKLLWDEKALEVLHKLPFYKPIVLLTPAVSPLELTENWKRD